MLQYAMDSSSVNTSFPTFPLAELHAHLGTSINPAVYWQIAHDLGFKLPKKDYYEFIDYITISADKPKPLNEYFEEIYHPLLDKLSSGTHPVERATYEDAKEIVKKVKESVREPLDVEMRFIEQDGSLAF